MNVARIPRRRHATIEEVRLTSRFIDLAASSRRHRSRPRSQGGCRAQRVGDRIAHLCRTCRPQGLRSCSDPSRCVVRSGRRTQSDWHRYTARDRRRDSVRSPRRRRSTTVARNCRLRRARIGCRRRVCRDGRFLSRTRSRDRPRRRRWRTDRRTSGDTDRNRLDFFRRRPSRGVRRRHGEERRGEYRHGRGSRNRRTEPRRRLAAVRPRSTPNVHSARTPWPSPHTAESCGRTGQRQPSRCESRHQQPNRRVTGLPTRSFPSLAAPTTPVAPHNVPLRRP